MDEKVKEKFNKLWANEEFRNMWIGAMREMENEFNKSFGTVDWVYRDIGWMKQEYWDRLIEALGEDNIKIIAASTRDDWGDSVFCRGQLLISPEGVQNSIAFADEIKNEIDSA